MILFKKRCEILDYVCCGGEGKDMEEKGNNARERQVWDLRLGVKEKERPQPPYCNRTE